MSIRIEYEIPIQEDYDGFPVEEIHEKINYRGRPFPISVKYQLDNVIERVIITDTGNDGLPYGEPFLERMPKYENSI